MSEMCGPGVAFECQEQNGLHIWEDYYIVEIIDPDTLGPVPEGEVGELVLTTINREAMSLLRYRTRDLTRILDVYKRQHIVPVYEIAYLADALVLNSIEFWSGSNPTASIGDVYKRQDQILSKGHSKPMPNLYASFTLGDPILSPIIFAMPIPAFILQST